MTSTTSTATHTIRLHRVLRAPPEVVYRAFLEPAARVKWLPPHGYVGHVLHSDVRAGGSYRMSFTSFRTGATHAFGGTYTELSPHRVIRCTDTFDDPGLPGEMQVTATFRAVTGGTELGVVQEGVPAQIPPEACYLGWQESLHLLALLVEADAP